VNIADISVKSLDIHTDSKQTFKRPRSKTWTAEQRRVIVERTFSPGMSVKLSAQMAGISSIQLFRWKKTYLKNIKYESSIRYQILFIRSSKGSCV
jgi:hypothetical protein